MCASFSLYLTYNEIREKGLCALADALLYNDSLHYIYLWGNEISEEAAAVRYRCKFYQVVPSFAPSIL